LELALDRGYAYTLLPTRGKAGEQLRRLTPAERLGAKGGSMNGSHRPDGILILAGAGVQPGARLARASITDVAPTLLHLLDMSLPAYLDGRVLAEALGRGGQVRVSSEAATAEQLPTPYSAEQAAAVGETLRGLGYQA
jgi:hypothetical protein